MPAIRIAPADTPFTLQSSALVVLVQFFLCTAPLNFLLQHKWRMGLTVVFPALAFYLVSFRYISDERACAIALSLTQAQSRTQLRMRAVLRPNAILRFRNVVLSFVCYSNILLPVLRMGKSAKLGWVDTGLNWGCLAVEVGMHMVLVGTSIFMCLSCASFASQDRADFEVDGEVIAVPEDEVPLKYLKIGSKKAQDGYCDWQKVSRTVTNEFVWIRRVTTVKGEEGMEIFELMMTLAEGHSQYKPESDGQPRDRILRITLNA